MVEVTLYKTLEHEGRALDVKVYGVVYSGEKRTWKYPGTGPSFEVRHVLRKLSGVYSMPVDEDMLKDFGTSLEDLDEELKLEALEEASHG